VREYESESFTFLPELEIGDEAVTKRGHEGGAHCKLGKTPEQSERMIEPGIGGNMKKCVASAGIGIGLCLQT